MNMAHRPCPFHWLHRYGAGTVRRFALVIAVLILATACNKIKEEAVPPGSVVLAFAGEAERAIEWGEQALRLSPFDSWTFQAWIAVCIGNFRQGRYEDAANAARKAVQSNPGFSISHMFLAAALAKLERIDEAKAAAGRVLALQPTYRISGWRAAIDPVPAIGEPLTEAMRAAGLPE